LLNQAFSCLLSVVIARKDVIFIVAASANAVSTHPFKRT